MADTERYMFIASVSIEAIAGGLGVTGNIDPLWGWVIAGGGFVLLGFALLRLFKRRQLSKGDERKQDEISRSRKAYLSRLKTKIIEVNTMAEQLLREVGKYTPSEYINSYYKSDAQYRRLVTHYNDEIEALLVQLLLLPTNPRLEEKLETNKSFQDARITINELSMRIGDNILEERINSYFKGLSQIGAEWLSSQLTQQYGKDASPDTKFTGEQVNILRMEAIRQLSWGIIERINQLSGNGG